MGSSVTDDDALGSVGAKLSYTPVSVSRSQIVRSRASHSLMAPTN